MTFLEIRQTYSVSQLQRLINESRSYREFGEKIGYKIVGSTSANKIKGLVSDLSLDVSHFQGQAWKKDSCDMSRFQKGVAIKSESLRKMLILKRGYRCECCGRKTWNGNPIPLQVHHEDGDRLNNVEDNLSLLCPNCHALTDNYCGKNIRKTESVSDAEFVKALQETENIRQALLLIGLTPKGANYKRAYALSNKIN